MSSTTGETGDDSMSAEFDTLAAWTADVALDLGRDHYVPAGCRGSGSPAALDWLLAELRPDARTRMLDCGAGVGGPAGYAQQHTGVRPVLLEPEAGACQASRRLFALPVVHADARALPFRPAAFDMAWSLGVLCTTPDQPAVLRELRRVLSPGGRLGLLVFVAAQQHFDEQPEGNDFPTEQLLHAMLREADLTVRATVAMADLAPPPPQWQAQVEEVERAVEARHGGDPALRAAQEQEAVIRRLFERGMISGQLLAVQAGS